MKTLNLIIIFFISLNSYAQSFPWNKIYEMKSEEWSNAIHESLLKVEDDIYFKGSIWNDISIGDTTLYRTGIPYFAEYYIAKFDKKGNFLWARREGFEGRGVVINKDKKENIYITGVMTSNLSTGEGELNIENGEIYHLKYSKDWELLSSFQIPASGSYVYANTIDEEGNTTLLISTTTMNDLEGVNWLPDLFGMYPERYFIIRYNANNELQWYKEIRDGFIYYFVEMHSNQNEITLTGSLENRMIIGEDSLSNFTNNSLGNSGGILKLSLEGDVLWYKGMPGAHTTKASEDGSFYVAGTLESEIVEFDNISITGNKKDIYVAKLNKDGNIESVFVEKIGGDTSYVLTTDIAFSDEHIVVSLQYFDPISLIDRPDVLAYEEGPESTILIFNQNEELEFVKTVYGACEDIVEDLEIINDRVIAIGRYRCNTNIDSVYLENLNQNEQLATSFLGVFDLKKYLDHPIPPEEDILIYPNPSFGSLTIDARGLNLPPTGVYSIELIDIAGRHLMKVFRDNELPISNLENLTFPTGIYTLVLKTEDDVYVKKILLQSQ